MVRTKINKHFNKETLIWGDMDFMEKWERIALLQSVYQRMTTNLIMFKKKSNDEAKIKEVEEMIQILRDTESFVHILFNQGESSERYAFEVTKVNLVHQRTIEELTKENEELKKNI